MDRKEPLTLDFVLSQLPDRLLCLVFGTLDIETLRKITQVSHLFNKMHNRKCINTIWWKYYVERVHEKDSYPSSSSSKIPWKKMFLKYCKPPPIVIQTRRPKKAPKEWVEVASDKTQQREHYKMLRNKKPKEKMPWAKERGLKGFREDCFNMGNPDM